MSGIYGNSPIDRMNEKRLEEHLAEEEAHLKIYCTSCDKLHDLDDIDWLNDMPMCHECETLLEL